MNMLKDRLKANPSDHEALEEMMEQMNSKNSFQRTAAIAYLGLAERAAAPAVPRLVEALNGSDGFNARAAAISLGQIGPAATGAIPDLIRAVEQKTNEDVGWFSAKSLGQIASVGDAGVLTVLRNAANSPIQEMRYSARAGLEALKSSR